VGDLLAKCIFCRGAVERFREMVDNLETVTLRDVTRAQAHCAG